MAYLNVILKFGAGIFFYCLSIILDCLFTRESPWSKKSSFLFLYVWCVGVGGGVGWGESVTKKGSGSQENHQSHYYVKFAF